MKPFWQRPVADQFGTWTIFEHQPDRWLFVFCAPNHYHRPWSLSSSEMSSPWIVGAYWSRKIQRNWLGLWVSLSSEDTYVVGTYPSYEHAITIYRQCVRHPETLVLERRL